MKIYPYQTHEGVIELVEKREYDDANGQLHKVRIRCSEWAEIAGKHGAEIDILRRANAELIERLAEARDVQTIQRQSVMLMRMANDLRGLANMPEYDQDDAHRLRHIASRALAAYESANLEPVANPIDEAVRRMEAIPIHDLKTTYRKGSKKLGLICDGVQAVRVRLISAAKVILH